MNTGKQINAMVLVLFLTLIAVGAYTIWDPFRSDDALSVQNEETAMFGAETFAMNCRLCHGDRGEGGQFGGRLAAAPALDRPELQGIVDGAFNRAAFDINYRLVTNTIMCGRAGTSMPTWGESQGGTLSDEQIRQLVVLITEGHWELAQEHADDLDAIATNHATLQMAAGSLSSDATTITVSNAGPFTLGQYIRIPTTGAEDERMRVLPSQLEIERGVNGTEAADHATGVTILRDGAPVLGRPSPVLSNGALVLEDGPAATLSERAAAGATAIAVGDTSTFSIGDVLQIEDETVRVTRISRGIPTTGLVLAKDVGRTPSTVLVSGAQSISEGTFIRLESELMTVAAVRNDGATGVTLDADVSPAATGISVSKATFLSPGYQVRIGDEVIEIVGAIDTKQTLADAIGTAQTTLSLSGTDNIEEGIIVRLDDELFRVRRIVQPARVQIERGVDGTQAASHTSGTAVLKAVAPPAEGEPPVDDSTGQTLLSTVTADGTTLDVTGTAGLAAGQSYKLDGETVTITSVEPALVKVERAVGGTKKAAHSRRATVYDGNRLAVERGVNGSTVSVHSADDALYMTALKVDREQAGSKVAEHAKNTEIFLGNELNVARAVLGSTAADHLNGVPVRSFPAPPDSPATNLGPTCSQRAVQPGQTPPTGPTPTIPANATQIGISLTVDFTIEADPASGPVGDFVFDVANDGNAPHNFRIIKSDLAPDALPVSNSAVDESQFDFVGGFSVPALQIGETKVVPANLVAGNYVLICNVPTHYELGMYLGFTVQ